MRSGESTLGCAGRQGLTPASLLSPGTVPGTHSSPAPPVPSPCTLAYIFFFPRALLQPPPGPSELRRAPGLTHICL